MQQKRREEETGYHIAGLGEMHHTTPHARHIVHTHPHTCDWDGYVLADVIVHTISRDLGKLSDLVGSCVTSAA